MHFTDLSIRRTRLLTTLASSVTAVVLATGGFQAWDIVQFRTETHDDLSAKALLIADGSSAALDFRDNRVALGTVEALSLRPQVELACLCTEDGELFEKYQRDPWVSAARAPRLPDPRIQPWRTTTFAGNMHRIPWRRRAPSTSRPTSTCRRSTTR